jgi:tetraacyldisaccharide 4'-kinase
VKLPLPLAYAARPAAALYALAVGGRNLYYDLWPRAATKAPIPVVCVGNLTTGGTGKTPMTAWLADFFCNQGLRPAILSRGYGRKNPKASLLLPPGPRPAAIRPEECGDEALVLKELQPDIPLLLDGDRVRGAKNALRHFQPDLLLLDDGFQHRRLEHDFNLIMVDGRRMFGNRKLLPAGPLREPLTALERADAVIINKSDQLHPRFAEQAAGLLPRVAAERIFFAAYRIVGFRGLRRFQVPRNSRTTAAKRTAAPNSPTLASLQERRLVAIAGLGNNDYFFAQLEALGLRLKARFAFGDHHRYTLSDLERLQPKTPDTLLLTTAKDYVKLARLAADTGKRDFLERLLATEIEIEIREQDRLLELFQPLLAGLGKPLCCRPPLCGATRQKP